ncbi:RNase HII [Natronoarchaeum philippinense]|uniref:Ribonuclease HII n=1 Tax=Natronoarchaeum philippinense TaxID=558529 RepID=A0A285P3M9_NATPI|nr:ribonuclease HII [Natronoarchaeum philippinense]SNZ15857.1 RNase HII [Natronoarchaeum philippinense]
MEYAFGADEAGRGPALGSMFVAAVAVDDRDAIPAGVDDSKKLSRARRDDLAAALRDDDRVRASVVEVPTERIDDPATDMNALTVDAQSTALDAVVEAGQSGVVDACDTDAERFASRVADGVDADVALRAEHGADETYPVVSAASVLAKAARDDHVDALAATYGEVGSGYPSDPTTRTFLSEYVETHGDLPDCARESWGTCQDALAAAEQSALDQF